MLSEEIEKAGEDQVYRQGSEGYDYIILAYGLCDNSIAGIKSGGIPLAVPRAHDCITLLLGSKERYARLFSEVSGTYWYSRGWIERSLQPGKVRYEKTYQSYVDTYGEDNAEYLMEMEQGWFKKYSRAFFIDWDALGNSGYYREYTKECADFLKWAYREEQGSPALMEKMLRGQFDEDEVLVVPPGKTIRPSYSEGIIRCE
jgi:hypothetical protein